MSQSGALSEEEIKNFVNETFNLKLDKDAFLKPSKDVVFDIYSRFLDDIRPDWRRPREDADSTVEPNLKFMMVGWLRDIFDRYNTGSTFNCTDIFSPTRKRTTVFLNVLIYFKVQLDESWAEWQQWKNDWAKDCEKIEELDDEVARFAIERDEKAARKGMSKSIDELKEELKKKQSVFDDLKRKAELKVDHKMAIKSEINNMIEVKQRKRDELQKHDEDTKKVEDELKLLDDGLSLDKRIHDNEQSLQSNIKMIEASREANQVMQKKKSVLERATVHSQSNNDELEKREDYTNKMFVGLNEKKSSVEAKSKQAQDRQEQLQGEKNLLGDEISNLERNRAKTRLQYKIKEEQALNILEQKKPSRKEFIRQSKIKLNQLKEERQCIEKDMTDIATKQAAESKKSEVLIDQAERRLESLTRLRDESRQAQLPNVEATIRYRTQIENIMCASKPADRTYIIESAAPNRAQ